MSIPPEYQLALWVMGMMNRLTEHGLIEGGPKLTQEGKADFEELSKTFPPPSPREIKKTLIHTWKLAPETAQEVCMLITLQLGTRQ